MIKKNEFEVQDLTEEKTSSDISELLIWQKEATKILDQFKQENKVFLTTAKIWKKLNNNFIKEGKHNLERVRTEFKHLSHIVEKNISQLSTKFTELSLGGTQAVTDEVKHILGLTGQYRRRKQ